MLFAVLMIILFINLVKGLVQTECCGALQLVHRGSSHLPVQLGVICYCCWYLCLLSVYPLAATPLFPPCQLSQGPASVWSCGLYAMTLNSCTCLFTEYAERRRQVFAPQCTIGTSPLFDSRDGFQMRALSFSHHRVSPDLSAMASPTLVVDPSDTTCRQQKNQLTSCMAWQPTGQLFVYVCCV